MNLDNNPFEYEAANNLKDEMIADYYIDDFNYGRFIQSQRNVFLVGERGSGKTMALLFNRWRVQKLLAERRQEAPPISNIGVYVPCNTPLTHKAEYQLLEEFQGSVISEHFLVLSLVYALVDTLSEIPDALKGADESLLRSEAEFVLGAELPKDGDFFEAIKQFVQRELTLTQRALNTGKGAVFYENTFTFVSIFVPLIQMCSSKIPQFKDSHFLLLIDDAHSLNEYQVRALNSWIAYRDHSLFSFKVAVAKVGEQAKMTSSGGSILEGHDYTKIDLEAPYQNRNSDFYGLAERLVTRRLQKFSIAATPREFFPMNPAMEEGLRESEETVRAEAIRKFGEAEEQSKAVTDYVYKYKRARYFKNRSSKANRVPYSGFDTLVFLSTGVVRNLLNPCFWMFDSAISRANEMATEDNSTEVSYIPPAIQTAVILEHSQRLWSWLEKSIAQDIEDCSTDDGMRIFKMLDTLAVHLRERLLHHQSEPCALSFAISGQEPSIMKKLNHLFEILRRGRLLYIHSGPAKDDGKRETYYIPNKMLWPSRGLDPYGQYARISIPAQALWEATEGKEIKPIQEDHEQKGFWDETR